MPSVIVSGAVVIQAVAGSDARLFIYFWFCLDWANWRAHPEADFTTTLRATTFRYSLLCRIASPKGKYGLAVRAEPKFGFRVRTPISHPNKTK